MSIPAMSASAMSVVTAITAHPRKPGRFAIVVDGRERATLAIESIERLRLGVGETVDERVAADIDREAGTLATYDRALNMLALRARSTAEMRRLLIKKGESAENADAAIARLLRAGFLDDASFARQFARSKAMSTGLSRRRLQQELARRGVAREIATVAIAEVFVDEGLDESETVERVARKKLATLARLDPPTQKRRLYAFLARRGYDSDVIMRVLRMLIAKGAQPDLDE